MMTSDISHSLELGVKPCTEVVLHSSFMGCGKLFIYFPCLKCLYVDYVLFVQFVSVYL